MHSKPAKSHVPAAAVALSMLLLFAGCGSSSAPAEDSAVHNEIITELNILAAGLEREDPLLASQMIDDKFVMGSNVSIRYLDGGWSGEGVGSFRSFFASSFALLQNFNQQFEVEELDVNGGVATCQVAGVFSAVRVDLVPPQNVNASGTDYMTFQRKGGQWLLVRWDEVPPDVVPVGGES